MSFSVYRNNKFLNRLKNFNNFLFSKATNVSIEISKKHLPSANIEKLTPLSKKKITTLVISFKELSKKLQTPTLITPSMKQTEVLITPFAFHRPENDP